MVPFHHALMRADLCSPSWVFTTPAPSATALLSWMLSPGFRWSRNSKAMVVILQAEEYSLAQLPAALFRHLGVREDVALQ